MFPHRSALSNWLANGQQCKNTGQVELEVKISYRFTPSPQVDPLIVAILMELSDFSAQFLPF